MKRTASPQRRSIGSRQADALALLAGLLTPLAFAPFGLFPLAAIAPAILFATWQVAGTGRAAWRGFLYGCGCFGVGVSWVYVSLHTYGHMSPPLAGVAVLLFVAGMSLYPAIVGLLQARFAALPSALRLTVIMPASFVLVEWLRGWLLTGFPWLNLGYSQTDTPLAGYAPWVGVYGMSLIVALTAGLLAAAWNDRRRALRWYLPMVLLLWLGGWIAGQREWVTPTGAPLRVALVQANIPLTEKWRHDQRQSIIDRHIALSEQVTADLIVWPEAAVPSYFDAIAPALLPRLDRIGRERGTDFLIGAVERERVGRGYYNSVFVVGRSNGIYRKQHLVPFGEFMPLPTLFMRLLATLDIPMSDFSAGTRGQAAIVAAGRTIGVSVCYEDAFGEEIINALPAATLLVNVSEDSWFGNSLAPHQRVQMARMRALESRRPMLRAANTGPSVVIDHRGEVQARSSQFTPQVVTATVQPMIGMTAYAHYGNAPVVVFLLLVLSLGALFARRYPPH
ncbi:MAG: apolipoprotein N-acyltransferase [Gammaproteobacteria bacterium]|nr:apolipoprotein N-acyltransferase [Gammaproteobacteria bacterium]